MNDNEKHLLEELEPEPVRMQYRKKDSKYYYAEGRDILGFYRPLQQSVIGILAERHPDKEEDIMKLRMQANGFINEATAGERRLKMHEFLAMHDVVMKDIDATIVAEYTYLMTTAFMYRYVLGKREVREEQVQPEHVGRGFEALYIMSVLPEDLAEKVKRHLVAFTHVDNIVFHNQPPCEVEEADG